MRAIIATFALLALGACDAPGPLKADRDAEDLFGPSEDNVIVVDAILIVDAPMPHVDVRRTLTPGLAYTADATALNGAQVIVRQGDTPYVYEPDPVVSGRYQPPLDTPLVMPATDYGLIVEAPGEPMVRATTTTPPRLRIAEFVLLDDDLEEVLRQLRLFTEIGEEVYYAPENQLEFTIGALEVRVEMEGAPASFQFAVDNLEAASPLLFDSDLFEKEDDFSRSETSPLLRLDDGALYLPWDRIYYAGRQRIRLYAVDRNWFDLVRTDNVDSERETGEAGQGFQRPLFHVENGIGLFGSASVDSVGLFVRRKGSLPCTGCDCWGCGDRSSWFGILDTESGKGRVRYERDVGTGATCELSYEIRGAVPIEACASCSLGWSFELGELTVYEDQGACDKAEDLEGLKLRFGQGVNPIAGESGETRYELYEDSQGFWEVVEGGWSFLLSAAGATQWLFGFPE